MKDRNKKGTPRRVLMYALLLAAAIGAGLALKAFDFAELAASFTVADGAAEAGAAGVRRPAGGESGRAGTGAHQAHQPPGLLRAESDASLVRYVAVIVILCGGLGIPWASTSAPSSPASACWP